MITGCATTPNNLNIQNQSLKYSNDISVVFGRLERLKNGQSAPYNADEIGSLMIIDNKLFDKVDNSTVVWEMMHGTNKCELHMKPGNGKYHIHTVRPDGYFIAMLTPGQYFIKGICIMERWGKPFPDQAPHIATFNVIPQKPTYIGTIQVTINEIVYYEQKPSALAKVPPIGLIGMTQSYLGDAPRIKITKDEYMKLSSDKQNEYSEMKTKGINSWQIKNEFEEAKKIFNSLYPNNPELLERLGEIKQDITKKN